MIQWRTHISGRTVRTFQFVSRQPSWPARVAILAGVVLLFALLAAIVIPAAVIGVVAFSAIAAGARVRAWLGGTKAPNGMLDGRRNVRVIVRE